MNVSYAIIGAIVGYLTSKRICRAPLEHRATAILSERSLEDWNRPEEDSAWSYLQRDR
jgi:hypothetical protein